MNVFYGLSYKLLFEGNFFTFKVVYLILFEAHSLYLSKERRFFCKFLFLPTRVKKWNEKADLSIATSICFWIFYIFFCIIVRSLNFFFK